MVGLLGRAAPTHTERTVKLASELLGTGDLAKQMHGMLLARALGGRAAGLLMSIERICARKIPYRLVLKDVTDALRQNGAPKEP